MRLSKSRCRNLRCRGGQPAVRIRLFDNSLGSKQRRRSRLPQLVFSPCQAFSAPTAFVAVKFYHTTPPHTRYRRICCNYAHKLRALWSERRWAGPARYVIAGMLRCRMAFSKTFCDTGPNSHPCIRCYKLGYFSRRHELVKRYGLTKMHHCHSLEVRKCRISRCVAQYSFTYSSIRPHR